MLHLNMNGISTRRRIFLLFVGCVLPLFLIGATTSWLHPEYLDSLSFSNFKPARTSSPGFEPEQEPVRETPVVWPPAEPTATSTPSAQPAEQWAFDTARDERNFGLSDEQCLLAFPDFYREIDRAVATRESFGPVTLNDVDISWREGNEMVRAMIYDRQLYIIEAAWADHGFDVPRALAILASINRAIVACPSCHIPDIEFSFCLGDIASFDIENDGKRAVWTLTRREWEDEKWVMPDFGYWSWPLNVVGEYTQVRTEIRDLEDSLSFADKKPLVVWRGSTQTNLLREYLVNATAGKSWSDIQAIEWFNMTTMMPGHAELSITMPEHCAYQFVVHTEGHSYSGRGKYLQNCLSVFIMHRFEWVEPHTHLLVPSSDANAKQNFVLVERNFSNLESQVEYLLKHPEEAQAIAEEGARVFRDRYLTPAAQACYWRRLFNAWRGVMGFEAELWVDESAIPVMTEAPAPPPPPADPTPTEESKVVETEESGSLETINVKRAEKGMGRKRMRGKPWETFILEGYKPVVH